MPIQVPVTQTGLEASIQAAATKAGRNLKINLGTNARNIEALTQPLGRITGKADEFTKSMEAANARVLAFGASVGVLNGVIQGFKNLVTTTIEVEKSLASINSILNQSSGELDRFKKQIFDTARNTEQSFATVAEAALELSRQGLAATEVTKRLNDSLILSRLSGLDAANAVAGLTAAINAFNSAGLSSGEILNKISAAAASAAVSERDLIDAIKRSGSVAVTTGVQFDELVGIVSALQEKTSRGGAVIGNSLKTIFTRIQSLENIQSLRNLGVQVTDLSGNVLSSNKLIENLAGTFQKLTQTEQINLADKLVGKFQIAPFLALLEDYNEEISRTGEVTQVSFAASDEAYKRNAALNKTLSAIINATTINVKELANALGEIGVTDSLRNIISFFDSVIVKIKEVFEGEGIGSDLAKGLIKGLSAIISGPGLAIFGAIIAKLSIDLVKFGANSLSTFFGLNKAAKEQAQLQGQIASTLLSHRDIQKKILDIENSTLSVEEKRRLQAKFFTDAINAQLNAMRQMQAIAGSIVPAVMTGTAKARKGSAAGGFLPVGAERSDIAKGVGGAPRSAKPVVIPNFAFGGGQTGTMVANSSEYIVPNFAGGGDAIFNQNMIASMGLPKGARKINAAGGFIPNFAEYPKLPNPAKSLDSLGIRSMDDLESNDNITRVTKNGKKLASFIVKKDGTKYVLSESHAATALSRPSKVKVSNLTPINAGGKDWGMIVNEPVSNGRMVQRFITKGQGGKIKAALTARGSNTIAAVDVPIFGINKSRAKSKTNKQLVDRITKYMTNASSIFAKDLGGGLMPDPLNTEQIKDSLNRGAAASAAGAIFEAGVAALLQDNDFKDYIAAGDNTPIDFRSNAVKRLKHASKQNNLFNIPDNMAKLGVEAKGSAADALISSTAEKIYKVTGGSDGRFTNQQKLENAFRGKKQNASGGYIPNFADGALEDAIAREKAAGLPVNQIRINQSGKLRNAKNPMGLAVTNTRDEPTGAIPNFAARSGASNSADSGASNSTDVFAKLFLLQTVLTGVTAAFSDTESTMGKFAQSIVTASTALMSMAMLKSMSGGSGQPLTQFGAAYAAGRSGNQFTPRGADGKFTSVSMFGRLGGATGRGVASITKFLGPIGKFGSHITKVLPFLGRMVPVLGQALFAFQALNAITGGALGKGLKNLMTGIGEALNIVDTPAEKAAKALDKLTDATYQNAISQGFAADSLEKFLDNISNTDPEEIKKRLSREGKKKVERGADASAVLLEESVRKTTFLDPQLQRELFKKTYVVDSGRKIKPAEVQNDKYIQSLISGEEGPYRVMGQIGPLKAEQLEGLRVSMIGQFASKEDQDAIRELALKGTPEELAEKVQDVQGSFDPEVLKLYKELVDRILNGTITNRDANKELVKELKDQKIELAKQESIQKIVLKNALAIAEAQFRIGLATRESFDAQEDSLKFEKNLNSTAKERKFAIEGELNLLQKRKKLITDQATTVKESLQQDQLSSILSPDVLGKIDEKSWERYRKIVFDTVEEVQKQGGYTETVKNNLLDELNTVDQLEEISKEIVDSLDIQIEKQQKLANIEAVRDNLNRLALANEEARNFVTEKRLDLLKKTYTQEQNDLSIAKRKRNADLELFKTQQEKKKINVGAGAAYAIDQQTTAREKQDLEANQKDEVARILSDLRGQFINEAINAGFNIEGLEELKTKLSGAKTEQDFQPFISQIEQAYVDQQKKQLQAANEEKLFQLDILNSEAQLVSNFALAVQLFAKNISFLTGVEFNPSEANDVISGVENVTSGIAASKQYLQTQTEKSLAQLNKLQSKGGFTDLRQDVQSSMADIKISGIELATSLLNLDNSLAQSGASITTFANLVKNAFLNLKEDIAQNQFDLATSADPSAIISAIGTERYQNILRGGPQTVETIQEANKADLLFQKRLEYATATDSATRRTLTYEYEKTLEILNLRDKMLKASTPEEREALQEEIIRKQSEPEKFSSRLRGALIPDEQGIQGDFENSIVNASVDFKKNLIDGTMEALKNGESLSSVLKSAGTSFLESLNKALMQRSVDTLLNAIPFFGGGGSIATGASGGKVSGGSGVRDDVPALLMGGEYIIKKNAVNKYGVNFFERLNNGAVPKFAEGGFFTPGLYGQDTISGKKDLLDFATQAYTSGKSDYISSVRGGGAISLEPESVRLTTFGRNRNTPLQQATADAKSQAFDLYLEEVAQEQEIEEAIREAEKAQRKAFRQQAIMTVASLAVSSALQAGASGFQAASAASKASGGTALQNLGAGFKGIFAGGNVGGQMIDGQMVGGVQAGGLNNLFSGAGKFLTGNFAEGAGQMQLSQIGDFKSLESLYFKNDSFASFINDRVNSTGSTLYKNNFPVALRAMSINEGGSGFLSNLGGAVKTPFKALGKIARGINLGGKSSNTANAFDLDYDENGDPWLLPPLATGGQIPTKTGIDTVPAMLSGGEFIMNSAATQNIGAGNLSALNSGASSVVTEEKSEELNEKIISKLDELIETFTANQSSSINITVNKDGKSEESSENASEKDKGLADKIRQAVIQIIEQEKRLGGTLRKGFA